MTRSLPNCLKPTHSLGDAGDKRRQGGVLARRLTIAGFIAVDLAVDQALGRDCTKRQAELRVLLLAGAGALWQEGALSEVRRARHEMQSALHGAGEEARPRRADIRNPMRGLGVAMRQQVTHPRISTVDAELALLWLKALCRNEKADAWQTHKLAVHEQACAIYPQAEWPVFPSPAAAFMEGVLLDAAEPATGRLRPCGRKRFALTLISRRDIGPAWRRRLKACTHSPRRCRHLPLPLLRSQAQEKGGCPRCWRCWRSRCSGCRGLLPAGS